MVTNPELVVGMSTLSEVLPFTAAILLLPVIVRNRSYLPTLCELSMIVTPRFAAGIIMLSVCVSVTVSAM